MQQMTCSHRNTHKCKRYAFTMLLMVACNPKTVFIIFVQTFFSPHLLYSCATLQLIKYVLAEPDRFVGACVTTRVTRRSCVTSNTCVSFIFLATPGTSTTIAQICVHQNPSSSWLMLPFFSHLIAVLSAHIRSCGFEKPPEKCMYFHSSMAQQFFKKKILIGI